MELRGRVLPLLSLRRLYALDTPEPPRCSVVVIHAGAQRRDEVRVRHALHQQLAEYDTHEEHRLLDGSEVRKADL